MEIPNNNSFIELDGVSEQDELSQWFADTSRLLKIGIRNHDPDTLSAVHDRISVRFDEKMADDAIIMMITHPMITENWSFFDENGDPSPLL